jgi:hypothetical protein
MSDYFIHFGIISVQAIVRARGEIIYKINNGCINSQSVTMHEMNNAKKSIYGNSLKIILGIKLEKDFSIQRSNIYEGIKKEGKDNEKLTKLLHKFAIDR